MVQRMGLRHQHQKISNQNSEDSFILAFTEPDLTVLPSASKLSLSISTLPLLRLLNQGNRII